MACPNTITGLQQIGRDRMRPVFDGTSFYVVGLGDSSRVFACEKADGDDPCDAWTEQDNANQPTLGTADGSSGMFPATTAGANLLLGNGFINVIGKGSSIIGVPTFAKFELSSDTWFDFGGSDFDIVIEDFPRAAGQGFAGEGIAMQADTDLIVCYDGDSEKFMGTEYERASWADSTDDGASWTAGGHLTVNGAWESSGADVCIDGSDRCYFVYWRGDATADKDIYTRGLSSGLTLQTDFDTTFNTHTSGRYNISQILCFNHSVDGDTVRILTSIDNASAFELCVLEADAAADISSWNKEVIDTEGIGNNYPWGAIANNGDTLYAIIFNFADTNQQIFDDGGNSTWGNQTDLGYAAPVVTGIIYDRGGGDVFGVHAQNEHGDKIHREISLGAAAASLVCRPQRSHRTHLTM